MGNLPGDNSCNRSQCSLLLSLNVSVFFRQSQNAILECAVFKLPLITQNLHKLHHVKMKIGNRYAPKFHSMIYFTISILHSLPFGISRHTILLMSFIFISSTRSLPVLSMILRNFKPAFERQLYLIV